jgi:hypothetical protein
MYNVFVEIYYERTIMSHETELESESSKNKVVLTPEDVQASYEFFTIYNIKTQPELKQSVDAFVKEPTFLNQNKFKLELAKALSQSQNEILLDPSFAPIRQACEEAVYRLQFEKDLIEELTS